MQLPEFLREDPDGEIRFTEHRIRLIDVIARYDEGHSPEGIVLDYYPTLSLPLVHRAIAFYLENQAEVRQRSTAMRRKWIAYRNNRATPALTELRRRLDANRREAS